MKSERQMANKIAWLQRVTIAVATGSTYGHRQVGCVAVNDKSRIISTGYNGYPSGVEDQQVSNKTGLEAFKVTTHAEANCMAYCRYGEAVTVYVSCCPCAACLNLLIAHGVKRVLYWETHSSTPESLEIASVFKNCIDLIQIPILTKEQD